MAVTLKEVAARAGVSRAAVSRVFTPGASASGAMRARVAEAAQALGYQPNLLARSLTTRRTQMVGLVSNNFHNPVFLEIFDHFTRRLQEADLRPLLINLSEGADPAVPAQLLRQYSVDGVILASSHVPAGFAEAFRATGVPVVHAFGRARPGGLVPVVGIDNVAAGRMAAETLLARGYRRLGFLGGPASASTTEDRLAGFRAAAGAGGAEVRHSFAESYGFAAGRARMQALLAEGPAEEAYFCADDVLSIGAMAALSEAGLRVPQDVGVLGLNDMEMAGWQNIALTTLHQPFDAIAAASVALMRALFDAPDQGAEPRVFACHLVERGSLRPVR